MNVTCSQCGVVKREVNHWFIARVARGHFRMQPFNDDPMMAREHGAQVVCGDNCAHKVFQKYLEESRVMVS